MIDTRRLLTTSKSITFYLHSEPTNAAEAKSQVKSLNDSNNYTITFEDTTEHLVRTTWERTIPVGTHEQIDTVIPWLYSFNIIGGLDNTLYTWQDASGNSLHSGIDSTTLQVDTLAQPITIQAVLELENYDNDTMLFYQVSSGTHEKTANQVLTTYDHNWNGKVTSSKPGKTVKDGTRIGLVLDEDPEDTTWTQTTNQEYNIEQTLYEDETGYKLVAKDAPGHEDKTINGTSTGTNNDDITLTGLTYDATIPLHVQSDGEPVQGATITHEEGTTTTGTNGEATINDTDLETNTYNEPLNTYNQTITTDAEGYEEEQTSIQYNHGNNNTQTITLQPTTYEYWIHGNTNAPNTNIKGWKDGEDIFTSTSNNGSYETNHQTSTLEQLVLDSLVANAEGYQKAKILEFTMQPGGTQQNLNLEEEPQNNTYTEKTIFANQTADEYDDGLTFIIKTRSDGQEHQTNINNNEHVQTITLEGPYQPTDSIELYYTPTSAATQGKEDKILTVTRSYEQPTASNGNRNTTLTTTIGELFNQTPDTTWILSLDKNLYDNEAFKTHVAGGKEWNYSENGQRTMTINAITRSVDISEGTYEDDLTTQEMQALRERTQLFNQEFWNRETGLKILNVNQEEPNTYQTSAGNINAFYDRTETQPGNVHYQVETSRYMTYDAGDGFVPHGTEMYLGQLTEETIQAVSWIFDYSNIGCSDVYEHDENNKPSITWDDPLIVPFTYVGGKAPKPE
jgi:hypothetical protein